MCWQLYNYNYIHVCMWPLLSCYINRILPLPFPSSQVILTVALYCQELVTHTYTHTHTHTHTQNYTHMQTPCLLNSIVLFDTLSLDFEIAEVILASYSGQTRALSPLATPKEGVAWQLNQRLSPPENLHVKVHCVCT